MVNSNLAVSLNLPFLKLKVRFIVKTRNQLVGQFSLFKKQKKKNVILKNLQASEMARIGKSR